ncbi:MAG TPA: COX15/CtaA family protein [Candidatus Dormibacteraeota bacterium]
MVATHPLLRTVRGGFAASERLPGRGFRTLVIATAVSTYLLIVAGGVVRVSGSGLGCGSAGGRNDWPYCQGGLLPPLQREAVIEFSHRWLAATVSTLALVLLVVAWGRYRHLPAVAWTTTCFCIFLVAQVILGAVTVYNLLPPDVVMTHLANAELLLGCAVLLCILAFNGGRVRPRGAAADPRRRRAARLAAVAAAGTYVLVISGALVVARGAGYACDGWPLCGNGIQLDGNQLAAYNLLHRSIAGAVGVLIALAVMGVARAFRPHRGIRVAGAVAAALLVAQVVAGAVLVESRLPTAARSIHEALGSALWAAVILLALLVRPGMLALDSAIGPAAAAGRRPAGTRKQPVATGTAS